VRETLSEIVHAIIVETLIRAIVHILFCARGLILINQTLDRLFCIIEFIERVLEQPRFSEMAHVGISLLQLAELLPQSFENVADRRVISKHHAADFVLRLNVG
jgi:hypothetical protein